MIEKINILWAERMAENDTDWWTRSDRRPHRSWHRSHKRHHNSHHRRNLNLMEAQSRIVRFIDYNKDKYDDKTFVHNLRGEIVHTSHDVYLSNGQVSHEIRQKVRRALWDYSKRKFIQENSHINLEEYRPPHEVKGIMKNIINMFFKK